MKDLIILASEIQAFLLEKKWDFCFIGGLALQCWGEMRLTKDVELTLLTGFGTEERFINGLLGRFSSRLPNPMEFALKNRVLLLKSENNLPLDVSLAGFSFEEEVVKRAMDRPYWENYSLRVCTAEDLIVYKAFAERPRDWLDVESIMIRQKTSLDWNYVFRQLTPLAEIKESPQILEKLQSLRTSLEPKIID